MYDSKNPQSVEKYSSAVTLSDMEIFIFPELLYSLVLANIMSPRIWAWRDDPWFSKLETAKPVRNLHRLKQYIMDNFTFNLDLDTWGLTTKGTELGRFRSFIDGRVLAESNALFGYEGDKYYFDIDIRKHFGLDRYTSDVIPYWKTETVEAMEAFRHKEGYPSGAGECVSLSTLYAAAAFVVTGIPLDDVYLYATPLHSQNFIDIGDGILTNNRRVVTKSMWFNGTELSGKARRALENERVTLVAHRTGYIHALYNRATIDVRRYHQFRKRLGQFLAAPISFEIIANFLRQNSDLQRCFQIEHTCCGKPRYIEAETVYHYEHSSKSRVGDRTQANLLHEIEEDEYYPQPIPDRLLLGELESYFKGMTLPVDEVKTAETLKKYLHHHCYNVDAVVHDLIRFCRTNPRLPDTEKKWEQIENVIDLSDIRSAGDAASRLESLREKNATADLAFSAFRDLSRSPWKPFLKAALERNPVSVSSSENFAPKQIYNQLSGFEDRSIYDSPTRMAQPDEVWNFRRGDGLEKAICMMNILRHKFPESRIEFRWEKPGEVEIGHENHRYPFSTRKNLPVPRESDFSFAAT